MPKICPWVAVVPLEESSESADYILLLHDPELNDKFCINSCYPSLQKSVSSVCKIELNWKRVADFDSIHCIAAPSLSLFLIRVCAAVKSIYM